MFPHAWVIRLLTCVTYFVNLAADLDTQFLQTANFV